MLPARAPKRSRPGAGLQTASPKRRRSPDDGSGEDSPIQVAQAEPDGTSAVEPMSLEGRDEAFGVEWEVAAKPESVDPMLRRMLEHACEAQYRPSVALVQRLFELSGQAADAKSSTGLFASGSSVPSLAGPPVSASVRVAIGFDCEWDVKFVKGLQPPVSVIQLGTGREAVVVHLPMSAPLAPANGTEPGAASREPGSQTEHTAWEVPASVRDLLEDESVAKLGINCSGDALKLARDFGVRTRGLVDVAKLWAAHTGAMTATGLPASIGLKEVAKAALGLDIPKDDHLRIAPWSGAKALTAARMRYAALDAALPVRVLQRMQAELTPLLSGGDASTKFEMAAEQPSYGKQPSQGPGKSQPAESTLLPASAGPRRQAAAAAARTADVAEAICGQPARKSSQAAVTPAAAYSAVATNLLAAQILPVSQESQALNRAAEQLARLPWEARAHAMWMWKQVPAQRLASALAKSVEDVLGAVLRAIEHRDGLEPPAEIVVLSERDGGAKGQGAHVEPAGERTVDDRDAARVVSVSSGLPYRWAGLSVSPRDEAACLRRLRCLEAATGLANAKLNPTPTTGGAAPASGAPAGTSGERGGRPRGFPPLPPSRAGAAVPPTRNATWHPLFGPRPDASLGAAEGSRVGGTLAWAIQVCIDEGGCITAHPGLAALEWPGGLPGGEWAPPFVSLTLPLPLRLADVDAAWAAHGSSSDEAASSPDARIMRAVLIHVSRMGLRGVATVSLRDDVLPAPNRPVQDVPVPSPPNSSQFASPGAPPGAPPGVPAPLQASATATSRNSSTGGGGVYSDDDDELDASD